MMEDAEELVQLRDDLKARLKEVRAAEKERAGILAVPSAEPHFWGQPLVLPAEGDGLDGD